VSLNFRLVSLIFRLVSLNFRLVSFIFRLVSLNFRLVDLNVQVRGPERLDRAVDKDGNLSPMRTPEEIGCREAVD